MFTLYMLPLYICTAVPPSSPQRLLSLKYSKPEAVNLRPRPGFPGPTRPTRTQQSIGSNLHLNNSTPSSQLSPAHCFPACVVGLHVLCLCLPIVVLGSLAVPQLSSALAQPEKAPQLRGMTASLSCARDPTGHGLQEYLKPAQNRFHVLLCSSFW